MAKWARGKTPLFSVGNVSTGKKTVSANPSGNRAERRLAKRQGLTPEQNNQDTEEQ